jgi:hypothetical protein
MATAQPAPEPGLYFNLRVTPDAVVIRAAAPIPRTPRGVLRRPMLVPEAAPGFKRSTSELVLVVLESDGRIVESFGWPAAAEIFHDPIDLSTGEVRGTPLRTAEWDGRLRVPVPDAARYLEFYRTDLVVDDQGGRRFSQTALALYDLRPGPPGPVPPLPVPWPWPPLPCPPFPPPRSWIPQLGYWRTRFDRPVPFSSTGYIDSVRTIISGGDPADKFDIVILGDGFQSGELGVFDARSDLLAYGLTSTAPFSNFVGRINVHAVRAVSVDSGITNVPTLGITRNTFFRTEGFWLGKPSPTFIGTSATDRVAEGINAIIPEAHADLIIFIINTLIEGGSAPLGLGLAFVTLYADPAKFISAAAHESAHVIGGLCEEYVSCTAFDPLRAYPNEVTQAEVDADVVDWKALATAGELDMANRFVAVHRLGDALDGQCQPVMAAGFEGMLGLYWGAQNSEPPSPGTCVNYCDTRAGTFYRPMAECKMRRFKYEFCRVCSTKISDAIRAVAP